MCLLTSGPHEIMESKAQDVLAQQPHKWLAYDSGFSRSIQLWNPLSDQYLNSGFDYQFDAGVDLFALVTI